MENLRRAMQEPQSRTPTRVEEALKSILGGGREEERLFDFSRDSKVGIRPPDDILETPVVADRDDVHSMDMLNET